jgi:hypothetical protein
MSRLQSCARQDLNRTFGLGIFKKRPIFSKSINIGGLDCSMTAIGNRVSLVFYGYDKKAN